MYIIIPIIWIIEIYITLFLLNRGRTKLPKLQLIVIGIVSFLLHLLFLYLNLIGDFRGMLGEIWISIVDTYLMLFSPIVLSIIVYKIIGVVYNKKYKR